MRHKHYDLIVKWAENPDAWVIEKHLTGDAWLETEMVLWGEDSVYRLIPRTRTMRLGDLTFPEPMREAPEDGTEVWGVTLHGLWTVDYCQWKSTELTHRTYLVRGLLHSTREAAEAHAKAMLTMVEVK